MSNALLHYKNLHQIPELSEKEFKTSEYIANALKEIGYTPHIVGDTGVFADLVSDASLPWLLFRADIDALPIEEDSGLPYSSQNDGVMHACGHDSHTAMLLEAAENLYGKKLQHNIRFLFQPAEETTTGASKVIDSVIPENLIACFAMHVWPQIPLGCAVTKSGPLMASSDFFKIKFFGKSSHCSQQEKGNNALLSAVDMVNALPNINKTATNDEALIFCGSIHSGALHNIVPDLSEIYGTIRTYSVEHRNAVKELLSQAAQDIALKYGTTAQIDYDGGCPPVYNDEKIVITLVNNFDLSNNVTPTLAGEDFSLFSDYAPSCMLWLGIGDTPPLHNEKFYVPNEILPIGVKLWCKIASHNWKEDLS
ncbi:MAG: amidohydrolase [Clostridia bacterium]|nr:amidohydrolase [Clostridia bacterium]